MGWSEDPPADGKRREEEKQQAGMEMRQPPLYVIINYNEYKKNSAFLICLTYNSKIILAVVMGSVNKKVSLT